MIKYEDFKVIGMIYWCSYLSIVNNLLDTILQWSPTYYSAKFRTNGNV